MLADDIADLRYSLVHLDRDWRGRIYVPADSGALSRVLDALEAAQARLVLLPVQEVDIDAIHARKT